MGLLLEAVHPGTEVSLAANFPNIEMRYVQAQAAKMGLTAIQQKNENGEECLKILNMPELMWPDQQSTNAPSSNEQPILGGGSAQLSGDRAMAARLQQVRRDKVVDRCPVAS